MAIFVHGYAVGLMLRASPFFQFIIQVRGMIQSVIGILLATAIS